MQIEKTALPDVLLIKPDVFEDHRGEYVKLYDKSYFFNIFDNISFVEDDISTASYGVLKGIHGNYETWKLISCLHGKFYLVVINYDSASKSFGEWESFVLSDRNHYQILVPPKYGNGHVCLSKKSIFHYKQSSYYNPKNQFTIKWNDQRFDIWWPIKNPILSRRDSA